MSRTTDSIDDDELSGYLLPGLTPGTTLARRFVIRRTIGSGGSAVVYAAFDTHLQRDIALKVLRSDRAGSIELKRFQREVVVAQRIASPNIVRVFDIGESEFGPFITMELVEGEPLRSVIERGPLPIAEAIAIVRQTLLALHALHEVGVMHRDVKPGNILIDPHGVVKLADFGLARRSDDDGMTNTGAFVGTLEYVAPEQALGRTAGPASDLYSVGIVLYELLTGRLPFERPSAFGAFLARVNSTPPAVRRLRPEVPRWLESVLTNLLDREPERRYQSAAVAVRAIDARHHRIRLRAWHGITITLVLAAVGAFSVWSPRSRTVARLEHSAEGVTAVAGDGSRLWTFRDNTIAHSAIMRTHGDARWIAVARRRTPRSRPADIHELTLIDARSGSVGTRVTLPDAAALFTQHGPDFDVQRVQTTDVTGDGTDEVIVTFVHTYWPSYTALYDPVKGESRLVLVASGHHTFNLATDVNGDGRKELIFTGINNRMGWSGAICAVDRPPAPAGLSDSSFAIGSSPDTVYAATAERATLWYTLLPPGYLGTASRIEITDADIRVEYPNGRKVLLDLHGFTRGSSSAFREPALRQRARKSAYASLRAALRSVDARDFLTADRRFEIARASARSCGDPQLVQWIDRNRAAVLVRAGRVEDGLSRFEELLSTAESPSDLAFEAARELHLRGDLDAAVDWYRRGLREDDFVGRMKYEFLEGIVLALVEQGKYHDALNEIARARRSYQTIDNVTEWYESYVRWRNGDLRTLPGAESPLDLVAYWRLEFRYARGDRGRELLEELSQAVERRRTVAPLVRSLRALLLFETGRREEAQSEIAVAWSEASMRSRDDTAVRAHLALVEARHARIAAVRPQKETADAVARHSL
jgi:tetratricopeptide (TPR) repeat protein